MIVPEMPLEDRLTLLPPVLRQAVAAERDRQAAERQQKAETEAEARTRHWNGMLAGIDAVLTAHGAGELKDLLWAGHREWVQTTRVFTSETSGVCVPFWVPGGPPGSVVYLRLRYGQPGAPRAWSPGTLHRNGDGEPCAWMAARGESDQTREFPTVAAAILYVLVGDGE